MSLISTVLEIIWYYPFIFNIYLTFSNLWNWSLSQERWSWGGKTPLLEVRSLNCTHTSHTFEAMKCLPIHFLSCFWEVGGHQGTLSKLESPQKPNEHFLFLHAHEQIPGVTRATKTSCKTAKLEQYGHTRYTEKCINHLIRSAFLIILYVLHSCILKQPLHLCWVSDGITVVDSESQKFTLLPILSSAL